MATFRELRAIHPKSDVAMLASMENAELRATVFACKILYSGKQYTKSNLDALNLDVLPAGGRVAAIRSVLELRAKHDGYTDAERAAVDVGDDDEWMAA